MSSRAPHRSREELAELPQLAYPDPEPVDRNEFLDPIAAGVNAGSFDPFWADDARGSP